MLSCITYLSKTIQVYLLISSTQTPILNNFKIGIYMCLNTFKKYLFKTACLHCLHILFVDNLYLYLFIFIYTSTKCLVYNNIKL